jgi:PAS domain S-box-containing protein
MTAGLPRQIVEYVEELESDDASAMVAVFDADGYYLYASPNHEQALGFTSQDLLSKHLSQTVDKQEHHAAWVLRTISVFHTRPMKFSSHLVAKSGELIHVAGTLRHMREPRRPMYFVTCVKPVRPGLSG